MTALRRWLIADYSAEGWREGARTYAPLVVPVTIWGLVTGVARVNAGMPRGIGIILSLTVYAGSAQLATLPLLALGTPLPVVWVTALLVNLRFSIFSAASRSYFADLTWSQRLFAGYTNGDLAFAVFSRRFGSDLERGSQHQHGFFYATAIINWFAWHVPSVIGIIVGSFAPTSWGLELAATMALLAVLIPMAAEVPAAAGVVVTGILAVLTASMPMKLGLLLSVLVGASVAVAAETWRERRRST